MNPRTVLPAAALGALLAFHAPDARACGGCFVQQSESTVVTGHRMAFAFSPSQTTLWDQISYSGDPKEFAWILPVRAGAVIELSTDAWFEALEAGTAVVVTSPQLSCGSSGGGCGSADASFSAGASDFGGTGGVKVLHEGTIGPYETVTLASTQPGALQSWLDQHGYVVPGDVKPVIAAYLSEGFDFIALRLKPGAGIREMKPVRVVTPGAGTTLPLRMVAAGTGDEVPITLFVIAEGRWRAKDKQNATIDPTHLTWDFASQSSTYAFARRAIATSGGGTYLTVFAQLDGLFTQKGLQIGASSPSAPPSFASSIAGAYVQQALANGETGTDACASSFQQLSVSAGMVEKACAGCTVKPGDIAASAFTCGQADDLGVALVGMHPKDVWLTRLEAILPRAALGADLVLEPNKLQLEVDNQLVAGLGINEDSVCPSAAPFDPRSGSRRPRLPPPAALMVLSALALAVARRALGRARTIGGVPAR